MEEIIVYSKKEGVNRLLPINTNDLNSLAFVIEKHYPSEKEFAYVLVDGIEIKLF